MIILDVQCDKCKNTQKYQWDQKSLAGKRKRCVYCGKSFLIRSRIVVKNNNL